MNRYLRQFFYTQHIMPVLIDASFDVGASGAPSNFSSKGATSVTRLSAGRYQVKLQDNFSSQLNLISTIQAPLSGSAIDPNTGTVGVVYQITAVGNTDWVTAGLPAGLVPTIGQVFKLAAAPAAGTGTVQTLSASGITSIDLLGSNKAMLGPSGAPNKGGYITFQCLAPTSASVTTLIPTDPAPGCTLRLSFYLSNTNAR